MTSVQKPAGKVRQINPCSRVGRLFHDPNNGSGNITDHFAPIDRDDCLHHRRIDIFRDETDRSIRKQNRHSPGMHSAESVRTVDVWFLSQCTDGGLATLSPGAGPFGWCVADDGRVGRTIRELPNLSPAIISKRSCLFRLVRQWAFLRESTETDIRCPTGFPLGGPKTVGWVFKDRQMPSQQILVRLLFSALL